MSNNNLNYGNIYSGKLYAKTKKYQKMYGFEIGIGEHDTWNNESDAFKHTFGSVELGLKSTHYSKVVGDIHEWQGRNQMGQSPGEENMDKWNNKVGRDIAHEIRSKYNSAEIDRYVKSGKMDDIIAEKVVQRMRKGNLITHPNDKRKYVEPKTPSQKFNDEIRAKVNEMKASQNEKLKRIFGKTKSSKSSGSGNGHWVTINGAHVFIED